MTIRGFRPFQPSDLADQRRLGDYIRELERLVLESARTIETLTQPNARARTDVPVVEMDLQAIKRALESGGVAELDLTNLTGLGAETVSPRFEVVTAAPDPYTFPHDLYVLTGGTFDTLWRIDRTQNPPVPIQIATVANHDLLSATHTDTVAASPVRGDVVVGNATPVWARLARGTANQVFRINAGGTDPEWGTVPAHNLLSTVHGDTAAAAVVRGDLVVGNSTPAWSRFAKGTALQLLRMNAGATDPEWGAVDDSMLSSNVALENATNVFSANQQFDAIVYLAGGLRLEGTAVGVGSSPYDLGANDLVIYVNSSGGAVTIRLPAVPTLDRVVVVIDATGNANANNITVSGNGNNINAAATRVMNVNYEAVRLIWSGSIWNLW